MKIARVTPVFKSGDNSLMINYRPISTLPCFSKMLERIMYNRLYKYLTENRSVIKRPTDSTTGTTCGQTDTTSGQRSTTNGQTNGQTSTTSRKTSTTSEQTSTASTTSGQTSTMSDHTSFASTTSDKTGSAIIISQNIVFRK